MNENSEPKNENLSVSPAVLKTPELNNVEYKILLNIINMASQKGLFTGDELFVAGSIYQKIKMIIEKNK